MIKSLSKESDQAVLKVFGVAADTIKLPQGPTARLVPFFEITCDRCGKVSDQFPRDVAEDWIREHLKEDHGMSSEEYNSKSS